MKTPITLTGPALHEFAFDIVLVGAVRVKALTEEGARGHLQACLDCADSNLGAWPDGSPILAELSLDLESRRPHLYEIDGESLE